MFNMGGFLRESASFLCTKILRFNQDIYRLQGRDYACK